MGKAELLFQLADPFSLGVDRRFEGSSRAATFPTASQGGEQGQSHADSCRTEDDQYQRRLILPQEEFDHDGIRVLKCKDCRGQREQKGKYQGVHGSRSHSAATRSHPYTRRAAFPLKTPDFSRSTPLVLSLLFPTNFNPFHEGVLNERCVSSQLDRGSISFCDEEIYLIDVLGEGGQEHPFGRGERQE